MFGPIANVKPFLEKLPASDLFELDEQIEGLIASRGWSRLQEMVTAGREQAQRTLDTNKGEIPSRSEFARYHGYMDGSRVGEEIVAQIRKAAADRRLKLEREAEEQQRGRAESSAAEV